MSPRIDDGRVRTENLGGLYDTDRPYLHAAMNRYTGAATIHGTLCGSDRSDDRRTVVTDEVTCPACRQKIDGGASAVTEQQWSRGDWMQTFTGRQFFPLDPRPEDIDPHDIAHALSLICRYGGHVDRFYSVAEHCVLMSQAVSPECALWALLHDATEAYVGDMVRPLKRNLPQYQLIEAKVWSAITLRFGIRQPDQVTPPMPAKVKEADNRILLTERAALMSAPPNDWAIEHLKPLPVDIEGWPPLEAEARYLNALVDLCPEVVLGDG